MSAISATLGSVSRFVRIFIQSPAIALPCQLPVKASSAVDQLVIDLTDLSQLSHHSIRRRWSRENLCGNMVPKLLGVKRSTDIELREELSDCR